MNKFYLLIAGSRDFENYELLKQYTDYVLRNRTEPIVIVSGGARGADTLAKQYAYEKDYEYLEFCAN
jgi:predicted Rossmann fold nucleotide-binding protein DprA/Smf involved in DNA uptake